MHLPNNILGRLLTNSTYTHARIVGRRAAWSEVTKTPPERGL